MKVKEWGGGRGDEVTLWSFSLGRFAVVVY